MHKKVIILSHDAMIWEDLDYLGKMPTFGDLIRRGAQIRTLRSIYPTITYPGADGQPVKALLRED